MHGRILHGRTWSKYAWLRAWRRASSHQPTARSRGQQLESVGAIVRLSDQHIRTTRQIFDSIKHNSTRYTIFMGRMLHPRSINSYETCIQDLHTHSRTHSVTSPSTPSQYSIRLGVLNMDRSGLLMCRFDDTQIFGFLDWGIYLPIHRFLHTASEAHDYGTRQRIGISEATVLCHEQITYQLWR